jgi:hypothetical protein
MMNVSTAAATNRHEDDGDGGCSLPASDAAFQLLLLQRTATLLLVAVVAPQGRRRDERLNLVRDAGTAPVTMRKEATELGEGVLRTLRLHAVVRICDPRFRFCVQLTRTFIKSRPESR